MVDPISTTLAALAVGIDSASLYHRRKRASPDGGVDDVGGVKEFWDAHRRGALEPGTHVRLEGSLSEYAPMIFGDPRTVKRRHFEFRDSLSANAPGSIDALVSISSGNPLVRLEPMKGVHYAGLYEAIGRNSIPVFVDADVFEEWRESRGRSAGQVRDVSLTGLVDDLPAEWGDFFSIFGLDAEAPEYAVYVRDDDSCTIEDRGETRFFEGDVWVAYEHAGERGWMTRCPDFAERTEVKSAMTALVENLEALDGEVELVSQYDLVDRPIGKSHVTGGGSTVIQELANERVREEYIDEVEAFVDEHTE